MKKYLILFIQFLFSAFLYASGAIENLEMAFIYGMAAEELRLQRQQQVIEIIVILSIIFIVIIFIIIHSKSKYKKCPYCENDILAGANYCIHCNKDIKATPSA